MTLNFYVLILVSSALAQTSSPQTNPTSHFAVSGDSRNCGDVVMPAIADGAKQDHAVFYWHLGDLRWTSDFDQDFKQASLSQGKHLSISDYHDQEWNDFIQNQIMLFDPVTFYVGIGNHETVAPKTRSEFLTQFSDWLNTPELREQRLKDNSKDHQVKTYYHWIRDGVDFINLDNASHDQFDEPQMKWFSNVTAKDANDSAIHTIVVGMHAALPNSISANHSMNEWPLGEQIGIKAYQTLLSLQNDSHKKVYVLASHSHFFMDGTYKTEYWRTHGGVLPGWIIGTAGAERYPLPPNAADANAARTNVYGYLLATVNPEGKDDGTISFEFKEITKDKIPPEIVQRYTEPLVEWCFNGNRRTTQVH